MLDSKPVGGGGVGRGGTSLRMSECLVGDETGVIIFTARNDQGSGWQFKSRWVYSVTCLVDVAQPGKYLTLRNARIDMFKGSMRVAVDQWGKIEETTDKFTPKVSHTMHRTCFMSGWQTDNNLSLIEFEMVPVPDA